MKFMLSAVGASDSEGTPSIVQVFTCLCAPILLREQTLISLFNVHSVLSSYETRKRDKRYPGSRNTCSHMSVSVLQQCQQQQSLKSPNSHGLVWPSAVDISH